MGDLTSQLPAYLAVIDDEMDLAFLFKEVLSQIEEVEVFAFTDPNLALEHFRTNHKYYRVVISDYRMPALTGLELLNTIKILNPAVGRIMMSAFEIEDELFKEYECVDRFLQKPVTMTDLVSEVRAIMNGMKSN